MFMSREQALPAAIYHLPQPQPACAEIQTPSLHGANSMWRRTVVIEGALGQDEAFSIGPDGMVWSFFPQPEVEGGYRLKNLHMPAEQLAVGRNGAGRLVVFASEGMVLRYRVETVGGDSRWTPSRRVLLPAVRGSQCIQSISCETIAKLMLVGAVIKLHNDGRQQDTGMAVSVWEHDGPVFRDAAGFSETLPNGKISRFIGNVIAPQKSAASH
jgi:hypothetical protein